MLPLKGATHSSLSNGLVRPGYIYFTREFSIMYLEGGMRRLPLERTFSPILSRNGSSGGESRRTGHHSIQRLSDRSDLATTTRKKLRSIPLGQSTRTTRS